jgi:hypothetical protein
LQIYFNGVLRLTCTNNFITNAFGGNNMVYWGATSATGGLNNQQYFCPSTVVILPVEMTSFENTCKGDVEQFTWTTASENRSDYFQLEYTYDGLVFYPAGVVDASGTTTEMHSYTLNIPDQDVRRRYYRIKLVDENGDIDYSDIIASKSCFMSEDLIEKVTEGTQFLTIETYQNVQLAIYNSLGQLMFSGATNDEMLQLDKSALSSGVYLISATTEDGTQQIQRVMLGATH